MVSNSAPPITMAKEALRLMFFLLRKVCQTVRDRHQSRSISLRGHNELWPCELYRYPSGCPRPVLQLHGRPLPPEMIKLLLDKPPVEGSRPHDFQLQYLRAQGIVRKARRDNRHVSGL